MRKQPHKKISVAVQISKDDDPKRWYTLSINEDGLVWIRTQHGEGFGMYADEVFEYLDAFFRVKM